MLKMQLRPLHMQLVNSAMELKHSPENPNTHTTGLEEGD